MAWRSVVDQARHTFTGRLTEAMLDAVFRTARGLVDGAERG
ncbi:MAG: hypothetical protein WD278_03175 [Pirellulales bacterium]